MRILFALASLAALLALSAGSASAQPPGGGGGFMRGPMLLYQESVRKELKLTDEQSKKVEELGAKMREKFMDLANLEGEELRTKRQEIAKEAEKAVGEILKPEQSKRLKEISYQLQGPQAFANPEVAKTLTITDDQKKDIQKINQELGAAIGELRPGASGPPDDETRKKMQEMRKSAADKIVKLLSEEQQKKWKDLQGEPFKGEIRFGPPRGGL